ncbi:hypothetical protein FQN60_007404 [Etheostoma spectabile]|uniref:Uncharacterized protein n=1 Tax=Etheostoma spectabile TaxID=54343 RepID=A0A5J5CZV7_9PERO|nr:hypothetical protein FQN60_007404 [Etheostoma spectabile]
MSDGRSTFVPRLDSMQRQSSANTEPPHTFQFVCGAPPEQRRANQKRRMSQGGRAGYGLVVSNSAGSTVPQPVDTGDRKSEPARQKNCNITGGMLPFYNHHLLVQRGHQTIAAIQLIPASCADWHHRDGSAHVVPCCCWLHLKGKDNS